MLTQIHYLLPADCASWGNLCRSPFLPLSLSYTLTPLFVSSSDCLKKKRRGLNCTFFPYCPAFAALYPSFKSDSPCATWSHSQAVNVFSLVILPHNTVCSLVWKRPIEWAICHWVSQESKAMMLTLMVQERWRHKGWWNHSPVADGENCAENVSQIEYDLPFDHLHKIALTSALLDRAVTLVNNKRTRWPISRSLLSLYT